MIFKASKAAGLFLWSLATTAGAANVDTLSAQFFAPDRVIKLELSMASWDELRLQEPAGGHCNFASTVESYTWFQAESAAIDGLVFRDIGIKKRNFCNSQSSVKPGLRVKFGKYNKEGKKLALKSYGVDGLTLNNALQDPSYLRQCLAYELFAQGGIKGPRCNFVVLRVNGEDKGLYVNIESYEDTLFARHYGKDLGNLYEISGEQLADWALPRLAGRRKDFTPDDSLTDIKGVIDAIANDQSEDLQQLAAVVDLEQFTQFWALEILLLHWDGMTRDTNNAYLYFPPGGKMMMVPWGTDQAFLEWGKGEDREIYQGSVLAAKLYAHPRYRQLLHAALAQNLSGLWQEARLLARIDAGAAVVAPYISPAETAQHEQFLTTLRKNVQDRRRLVGDLITAESAR